MPGGFNRLGGGMFVLVVFLVVFFAGCFLLFGFYSCYCLDFGVSTFVYCLERW